MKTHRNKERNEPRSADSKPAGPKAAQRFVDNRPIVAVQKTLQLMADQSALSRQPLQRAENSTGMPDELKSGIENLSGYSLDPVKVHYNSPKPAAVQAHAYAQGSNIHLGPGQEKHLPHEAWHVVQQMQGRVQPTTEVNGQAVNDNGGLEREADVMGSRALQLKSENPPQPLRHLLSGNSAMQRRGAQDLPDVDVNSPFDTPERKTLDEAVKAYNLIPATDKVYALHQQRLSAIQALIAGDVSLNDLDQAVDGELNTVEGQMTAPATASTAEFASVDTTGKVFLIKSRPAELNKLAEKFKTAADDNARFSITLEMQDYIDSWKADYVEGGQIKASITDPAKRADRETKYAGIKLMETQLIHSRKALYDALFTANTYDAAEEPEGSVKTAFDVTSTIVEEGAGDVGKVNSVFKESLGEVTKAGLSGTASGADGLVQIYKLINIGREFKEQGGGERFLSTLEGLESLGTGISDGATLAMSIGGDKLPGAESTALWTEGLAEAIGGLRSAILGVISLIKAFKKRGIDPEHAREEALSGGLSLVSAAGSAAKAAKVFFEVAEKTVPPSLLTAIPALGIAVNAATIALSLYQGYQGAKKEKGLKTKMSTFLGAAADPAAGLVAKTNLSDAEIAKITHLESRGVYGKLGGKNYLRFNAYVMAKIDDHDFSTGALTINIDGAGDTVTISKADALAIREYEYISKMTEINQKRKIRGLDNSAHAIVSMAGDITTLSMVGALVGTSLKAAASGSKVAHSVAITGQQISRNRQRDALEQTAGANISAIPSQKAYTDAFPTSWGRTNVDKSRKQKETEYRRHAAYVLERLSLIPAPASPTDYSNSVTAYNDAKELIKVTGVDYPDFLKSATLNKRFDLLVAAQKASG